MLRKAVSHLAHSQEMLANVARELRQCASGSLAVCMGWVSKVLAELFDFTCDV